MFEIDSFDHPRPESGYEEEPSAKRRKISRHRNGNHQDNKDDDEEEEEEGGSQGSFRSDEGANDDRSGEEESSFGNFEGDSEDGNGKEMNDSPGSVASTNRRKSKLPQRKRDPATTVQKMSHSSSKSFGTRSHSSPSSSSSSGSDGKKEIKSERQKRRSIRDDDDSESDKSTKRRSRRLSGQSVEPDDQTNDADNEAEDVGEEGKGDKQETEGQMQDDQEDDQEVGSPQSKSRGRSKKRKRRNWASSKTIRRAKVKKNEDQEKRGGEGEEGEEEEEEEEILDSDDERNKEIAKNLKIGDCVALRATEGPEFIGVVTELKEIKNGVPKVVELTWFYRNSDVIERGKKLGIKTPLNLSTDNRELYLSNHADDNEVSAITKIVQIIRVNKAESDLSHRKAWLSQSPDHFYYTRKYNFKTHTLVPLS